MTQMLPQRPALGPRESQEGLPEGFRCGQEGSAPGSCPERQEWGRHPVARSQGAPDPVVTDPGRVEEGWLRGTDPGVGPEPEPGSLVSSAQFPSPSNLPTRASPSRSKPSPRVLLRCLALPDSPLSPKAQQPGLQLWWKPISKAPFTEPRSDNAAFIPRSGWKVGPTPSSLWL